MYVSSLNMGSGTPCTIIRNEGKEVESCPADTTASEYRKEALEDCKEILDDIEQASEIVNKISQKKTPLNGKEKEELISSIRKVKQQVKNNLPFLVEQLQSTMDKVVEHAKIEIENHFAKTLQEAGVEYIVTTPHAKATGLS
jgi:flagellar biosynthesis component FlhA